MFDQVEIDNTFRKDEIFEMYLGRIVKTKQQVGRTDKKYMVCDIELGVGGDLQDVPLFGPSVDLNTGNPHGIAFAPRNNSLVGVLFLRGMWKNPVGCFPLPFPSWEVSTSDKEKYNNIMDSLNDLSIFHYTGTRIDFREDGSIEIAKKIDDNVYKFKLEFQDSDNDAEKKITDVDNGHTIILKKGKIILNSLKEKDSEDSGDIELGKEATEKLVLGDAFKSLFNGHKHPTPVGPSEKPIQQMTDESHLSKTNRTI